MPNLAFHQEVLKKAITSPSVFAGLGAVGPDLYQYQPISAALSDSLDKIFTDTLNNGTPIPNPLTTDPALSAELNQKPLMAAYALLFREIVVPFWPVLVREADVLNQLQTIAANSDSGALKTLLNAFSGGLSTILTNDAAELKKVPPAIQVFTDITASFIKTAPPIQLGTGTPSDPTEGRLHEFLRWHHTNKFAQNLSKIASSGTADQQDYAKGYLCHIATAVTGEPFINNIAGGPYRTHWWRNRFVANFVDTWTYGRYNTPASAGGPASMSGNTPTPAYSSWEDIRKSQLWTDLDVSSSFNPSANLLAPIIEAIGKGDIAPQVLLHSVPTDIVKLISKAIDETWLLPADRPAGFKTDADINQATQQSFVGLLAVVYFMTSGFGPWFPFDLGSPPGPPPSWLTSGGTPPPPTSSGPSTGATVCGVILSILALLLFLTQSYALGAAAVAGAIAAFESGGGIDFGQLAIDVWYLRQLLLMAENALVNAVVFGGLGYPAPDQLGTGDGTVPVTAQSLGLKDPFALPLTKSNQGISKVSVVAAFPAVYPIQMDATNGGFADTDYSAYPPLVEETPGTMNLPTAPGGLTGYADMVLDGSPPQTPGTQNSGMALAGLPGIGQFSKNAYFGDCVSNANQLLSVGIAKLPSYNLDADRGYGWITWNPEAGTLPNTGNVAANPEI